MLIRSSAFILFCGFCGSASAEISEARVDEILNICNEERSEATYFECYGQFSRLEFPGEIEAAADSLQRRCDAGDGHSCLYLGDLIYANELVGLRTSEVQGLSSRACDLDIAGGCFALATNPLTEGLGSWDPEVAETLIRKACNLSDMYCLRGYEFFETTTRYDFPEHHNPQLQAYLREESCNREVLYDCE